MQGYDWLDYANQGAIRDDPISDRLANALNFLPGMGITMKVFSGGQEASGPHRTGSHRHDHGNAADVFFYKDGRRLDWANPRDRPIFEEIVREGRERGLTGFGAGPGYMREGSMHVGFGTPAVWGAGGKSANAPDWLRDAYYSAPSPGAVTSSPLPDIAPVPTDYPSQRVADAFSASDGAPFAPPLPSNPPSNAMAYAPAQKSTPPMNNTFPPPPNTADALNAAMTARKNLFPAAPSPTQNGPVMYGNLAGADFPHSPSAGTAEQFKSLGGGLGGLGGTQPGSALGSNLGTQKERIIDVIERLLGFDNNATNSGLSNLFPAAPNMPAQSGSAPIFNISPTAMAAVNAGKGGLY